jgi:hypothetical protein
LGGALYSGKKFKRVFAFIGAVSLFLSVIRIAVLFIEAYSLVAVERLSDTQLLKICREQESAAIASSKLRGACLSARTDSAAQLVFKALLKAVATLFADFAELFSSPTRVVVLILFVVSGLGAPVVTLAFRTFLAGLKATSGKDHESDDDSDVEDMRQLTLVVNPGIQELLGKGAPDRHGLLHRRRAPTVARVESDDEADSHGFRSM